MGSQLSTIDFVLGHGADINGRKGFACGSCKLDQHIVACDLTAVPGNGLELSFREGFHASSLSGLMA
jgi:hypothetical protein